MNGSKSILPHFYRKKKVKILDYSQIFLKLALGVFP